MNDDYSKDRSRACQAQREAHEIVFGPVMFQVARAMVKYGVFSALIDSGACSADEISESTGLSRYAVQVLLEASLTAGTVLRKDGKYSVTKKGWFLQNDEIARVNMDVNHDVNYKGLFHLDEALEKGFPAGLKELGNWPTIYEGLSSLPEDARRSWFNFDHYYSDASFDEALKIVFSYRPKTVLDVGGNTGKWALKCVAYDSDVKVTVFDLPQQIAMMRENVRGCPGSDRIAGVGADILKKDSVLPAGCDIVWMSQFLDCFSAGQVTDILKKAGRAAGASGRIVIMETVWDRQKFGTAAFDLTQISLYFTVMANGNSKMFASDDLLGYISGAGLEIEKIYDNIGYGHSIIVCGNK